MLVTSFLRHPLIYGLDVMFPLDTGDAKCKCYGFDTNICITCDGLVKITCVTSYFGFLYLIFHLPILCSSVSAEACFLARKVVV